MLFGEKREDLRGFYASAWAKAKRGLPLEALEEIITRVIADHPEYHQFVTDSGAIDQDFSVENGQTNPFLHMGLHITITEQVSVDRPPGIRKAHQALLAVSKNRHEAEHKMIDCLAETLWQAQRNQCPPDESVYLSAVQKLTR